MGLLGDRPQARVRVAHGRGVFLALRVGGDVGHRAWSIEGAERDQVGELGRLHLAQGVAHPLRLELEDAGRIAAGQHLVGLGVVDRDLLHVDLLVARAADDVDRVSITSRLRRPRKSIFSRPSSSIGPIEYWVTILYWRSGLADPLPFGFGSAGAVLSSASCSGTHLLQRPVGDHHRGGVDRVVADDPLEPLGDVDDPFRVGLGVIGGFQLLALLQAFGEGRAAAHDRLRDQLGEAVAGAVVEPEHAGGIAGRRAWRHLAEGDDLGDRFTPVLVGDVADHPLATATEKSMSISGIDLRPGLRKRSKIRPSASGSRSVILRM